MRAVIQRVLSANASADGKVISSIQRGLCVLIGISRNDTKSDIEFIVKKILNLKLFEDNSGKRWSKSVKDCEGEILCLSQVTLYNTCKGNKLDFHHAMAPDKGKEFYHEFLECIRTEYKPELVKEGIFGAHLVIGLQNDGPVTITLESPNSGVNKEEMEHDVSSSQNKMSKIEKIEIASVKQDSTSSQTCLIKQDSSYSQTNQSFGDKNLGCGCSQVENGENKLKKGSTSSQTCLVKQDDSSSQTCLVKQDSTSSQTHLIKQDSISSQTHESYQNNDYSSQTIKVNEVIEDDNSPSIQDSKFSQTSSILQSNVSSQTQLVKQDSVSSQTCSRLQEGLPNSATSQATTVNII